MTDADLVNEIALLSGRVEILMRLLGRIISKMDPDWITPENDPERKRRSDLLAQTVIEKIKFEAVSQAQGDPETTNRLARARYEEAARGELWFPDKYNSRYRCAPGDRSNPDAGHWSIEGDYGKARNDAANAIAALVQPAESGDK